MSRKHCMALEAWVKQGLRCHWCRMYIPVGVPSTSLVGLTLDHLAPSQCIPNGPKRPAVAAHKGCNNTRHHDMAGVGFDVVKRVRRALVSMGFETR